MHGMTNISLVLIAAAALIGIGDFRAQAAPSDDPVAAHNEAAAGVHPEEATIPEAEESHADEHGEAKGDAHAAAGDHGAEGDHAKTSGLPQLDPTWFASQIFWLVLTFVGLYAVFARKILPDMGSILEKRRATVQENLDRATALKNEAERLQKEYEEALSQAHARSAQLFANIEADIKAQTALRLAELRERSSEEIQKAEIAILKAKKDAMEDMNSIAAEIASLAAEKIVGISTDIDQARSVIQNINKKAA